MNQAPFDSYSPAPSPPHTPLQRSCSPPSHKLHPSLTPQLIPISHKGGSSPPHRYSQTPPPPSCCGSGSGGMGNLGLGLLSPKAEALPGLALPKSAYDKSFPHGNSGASRSMSSSSGSRSHRLGAPKKPSSSSSSNSYRLSAPKASSSSSSSSSSGTSLSSRVRLDLALGAHVPHAVTNRGYNLAIPPPSALSRHKQGFAESMHKLALMRYPSMSAAPLWRGPGRVHEGAAGKLQSLSECPDDVVARAFAFLSILECCRVRSVTRAFERCVVKSMRATRVIDGIRLIGFTNQKDLPLDTVRNVWREVLQHCPNVHTVIVDPQETKTLRVLHPFALFAAFPKMRHHNFGLAAAANLHTLLQCPLPDEMSSLSVDINDVNHVPRALPPAFSSITTLWLRGFSSASIAYDLVSQCVSVESMSIHCPSPMDWSCLRNLPRLTRLACLSADCLSNEEAEEINYSAPNLRSLVFRPESLQSDVGKYLPRIEMIMVCVAQVDHFMQYIDHIDQYTVVRSASPELAAGNSGGGNSESADGHASDGAQAPDSHTDTDREDSPRAREASDDADAVPLSDRYFAHFPNLKTVVLPVFSSEYSPADEQRCRFTNRTGVDIVLQRVDDNSKRKICDRCGRDVTGNAMRQQCSCFPWK